MKMLFVASLFNEGIKSHGFTYEYYNLFQSLERVVNSLIVFDFMKVLQEQNREKMNQALLETVKCERPDVTIIVPYTDQLIPEVIDEVNRYTITVAYFFDDMWRINYARFWANHFTFITTSDVNGIRKFRDAGYSNVIYSPFACNHRIFVRKDLPKQYDVSFVGQYHPYRAWLLSVLKKAGISVNVWGRGWETNHLNEDAMVDVFNQSRVNLNLSNSISWDARYLFTLRRPVTETLRVWRGTINAFRYSDYKIHEQVKGRHFEINACGGFQLSYYVEGIECHYRIGDEITIYTSPEELVEKVRYYLKHEAERESISQNGYERTLRDHTMEKRFRELIENVFRLYKN
jgi:spore maturation protein CgeB